MRIVVLGGGPGGYAAAFEAARLGAEVVLVEKERLGGTCLNWGCIPTKAILRSAHIAADTARAIDFGLDVGGAASVDVERLRARKEDVVDELVSQVESTARRLKVRVLYGIGRLAGPNAVEVELTAAGGRNGGDGDDRGGDEETERVEADAIILASGSLPVRLPVIDHDLPGVWTSDQAVSLSSIPGEIVIVGGGAIGLEFACAYAAFGSEVTVVEIMEQVLPGNDRRVAKTTQAALERMGVSFLLADAVESVEQHGDRVHADLRSGQTLEADVVLSAPGRFPNSAGLGYEDAGLEMDRAAVKVDNYFRTSVEGIFAIGDLIGGMMLAHVAEEEGTLAARNAVAELKTVGAAPILESVRYECVPACVYTFPEVAVVGATRDSAKERGIDAIQAIAKFAANGKALAEGEAEGFVQMVAEKGTGRIVGCQIVGPHAVEIVHEIAVAMRHDIFVRELAETVHAHPTVSEAVKLAAVDAAGKCGC